MPPISSVEPSFALTAVGISGSPSAHSKSRTLLRLTLEQLSERGVATQLIDLSALPADALLGRRQAPELDRALAAVAASSIVIASTPVYRATYSGLLKVFFDLFAPRALTGKIGVAIATAGAPGHQLVLDYGLAPLFASVGAVVTATGIFATDAEFAAGIPDDTLRERIASAAAEAVALAETAGGRADPLSSTGELTAHA
jgi:FMN reductase